MPLSSNTRNKHLSKMSPFSRSRVLWSKENNNRGSFEGGETSFRVYSYYGANGATIPFNWESQPGTPKHPIFNKNDNIIPPLTPPPSYTLRNSSDTFTKEKKHIVYFRGLLNNILRISRSHVTPTTSVPSLSSYASSSSSSSISSSSTRSTPRKKCSKTRKRSLSFCSPMELKFPLFDEDEKEQNNVEFSTSSSMCFGFKKQQGCYSMQDNKNAFF